jgi:RecA/RadA recombinase
MAAKKRITEAIADGASDRAKTRRALQRALGDIFAPMSGGSKSDVEEVIPSGLEVLDKHVLGCGGWPVKRIVEVFGDPSS